MIDLVQEPDYLKPETDDFFLVLDGELTIQLRDTPNTDVPV